MYVILVEEETVVGFQKKSNQNDSIKWMSVRKDRQSEKIWKKRAMHTSYIHNTHTTRIHFHFIFSFILSVLVFFHMFGNEFFFIQTWKSNLKLFFRLFFSFYRSLPRVLVFENLCKINSTLHSMYWNFQYKWFGHGN